MARIGKMKILEAQVINFASYQDQNIDFTPAGLSLIHGATGSGKSTIQDIVCWAFFGRTAKGGSVDEVRSWNAQEKTSIALDIEINNEVLTIFRSRGKSKDNDLFYIENDNIVRGKDLVDTQKLLEAKLGFNFDLYVSSAYFHEFSPINNFFTANAKIRREVFENIADLSLPLLIYEKTAVRRKELKTKKTEIEASENKLAGKLEQLILSSTQAKRQSEAFDKAHKQALLELQEKVKTFDLDKETLILSIEEKIEKFNVKLDTEVDQISEEIQKLKNIIKPDDLFDVQVKLQEKAATCDKCGSPNKFTLKTIDKIKNERFENSRNIDRLKQLCKRLEAVSKEKNPYLEQLDQAKRVENTYDLQLAAKRRDINPFKEQVKELESHIANAEGTFVELVKHKDEVLRELNAVSFLYDLCANLRGELLKKAVKQIEQSTNKYLERFFDSEFKVEFSLVGADKLEIDINKSGNQCTYTQLSKGQRQLLKLSFAVSMMKAASNKIGIHFDNLFFDESLDGMDADLKIKAYDLFQELDKEHKGIMVIEHSTEFKSLFNKQYHVKLIGDNSVIEEY